MRQDRSHDHARHVRRQQSVAVLAEHRRDPDQIVDAEAHEPPEQQVVIHLLHQLPLGSDREQDLQQAGADQPLRRDRRTTFLGVENLELGIEPGQRVVHDPTDQAQRMPRRDALLEVDIAEQRPCHLVRSAHAATPRKPSTPGESWGTWRVEAGFSAVPRTEPR